MSDSSGRFFSHSDCTSIMQHNLVPLLQTRLFAVSYCIPSACDICLTITNRDVVTNQPLVGVHSFLPEDIGYKSFEVTVGHVNLHVHTLLGLETLWFALS